MRPGATNRGNEELSLDAIVAAAVELLDAEGIDAFSMRALARHLGRSTMGTYRHVPNRDTLLQLAADAVRGDLPDAGDLSWYERLETYTRYQWVNTWRAHPWVADYIGTGNISPQSEVRGVEWMHVFRDAGFDEEGIRNATLAYWAFVQGTLRLVLSPISGPAARDPKAADALFEFHLRAWIAGLSAVVNGWTPATLARDSRGSPRNGE